MPILAAGGIADGRTLAAALTAGTDGAWVGTALLATPEAVDVHDLHKDLIVGSDGTDTVFTRVYDIVSGLPWPASIGERVHRNRFTDEWSGRDVELNDRREEMAPSGWIQPVRGATRPRHECGAVRPVRRLGQRGAAGRGGHPHPQRRR